MSCHGRACYDHLSMRGLISPIIGLFLLLVFSASLQAETLESHLGQEVSRTLETLTATKDFQAAADRLDGVIEQLIWYVPATKTGLYRDAVAARRLVEQLRDLDEPLRSSMLAYLLSEPELMRMLVYLATTQDEPPEVYGLLDRLREARGQTVGEYPNLTTALCLVHDKQLSQRVNENQPVAADPVYLLDYFVHHQDRLLFGLRGVPAELLMYVVDCTVTLDDMVWSIDRYAGDQNVGQRFFDIAYDFEHFRNKTPKKCTTAGYSLQNIHRFGGVCADQAYFAMSVGKSIGVPTAYVSGMSSEYSHAWVGFLQYDRARRRAWWNFNTGRYPAYQGVRGRVKDPQTRRFVTDSYISLLADVIIADPADRQAAAALSEAARRAGELSETDRQPPELPSQWERAPIRGVETADQLALLEASIRLCPGFAPGWFSVMEMARDGQLSLADKKKWAKVLDRLCGQRYPDFYLAVLEPMIATVDDLDEQNRLWNAAFKAFQNRSDLAAHVRMSQANLWKKHGQPLKAGQCYEDVINRYANAGPFVLHALAKAEQILREARDGRRMLRMYEQAWSKIKPPEGSAFYRQSNWYRVGLAYADRLTEAGLHSEAQRVRRVISQVPG